MTVRTARAGLAAILAFGAVLWGQELHAASLLEKNFWLSGPRYDGVLPPCDAPAALERIAGQFAETQRTYWNSAAKIVGFGEIHENAFRPWASDTIPRRWCAGVAQVSDGRRHPLYYQIAEDTGWLGVGWGIEFCLVGFDRNWAFNPACKMARP